MQHANLKALSPIDGRYGNKVSALRNIFSEYGLIRHRVLVEVRWLQWLANEPDIEEINSLSPAIKKNINNIVKEFSINDAERIKEIEATTNHDVKAVEYYIAEKIGNNTDIANIRDFIHFGCTSEDINNLAYGLMLHSARNEILSPQMEKVLAKLRTIANKYADLPMLSRTHGQIASPTTLGKEIKNFIARLARANNQFANVVVRGKFNGAVGNFNAHVAAYPEIDWPNLSQRFIESLGLHSNLYTTQIEPHDWIAEYAHT